MLKLRPIRPEDDPAIDAIIRDTMIHLGAPKEGTILGDPTRTHMSQNYPEPNAVYFIAEWNGEVVGGAGIRQLEGTPEAVCELQRMFLHPKARGKGIGKALMEKCIAKAVEFGYRQCYLETLSIMEPAQALYRKYGFEYLEKPLGDTGHGGCQVFMAKQLDA